MLPRGKSELSIVVAGQGGVLKLEPHGKLYTGRRGEQGEIEPIPPEQMLRYYFRVRIEGKRVHLTQEGDEYGRMMPFAFVDKQFPLEIGKPVAIYFNVPGGGPEWTLTLVSVF